MKNNINGSLQYRGIVKISTLKGNKVIKTVTTHNSGTAWLFQVISSMLCGNDERTNVPRYFDIGTKVSEDFTSSIANRIALSSKVIKNFQIEHDSDIFNSSWGASFSALVPSISIVYNTARYLRLYSTKGGGDDALLAEVDLENPITLNFESGYNYLIEWVMTFENALTRESISRS